MEFIWCLVPPELTLDPVRREIRATVDLFVGKKFLPLLGTLVPIAGQDLKELDKDDVRVQLGGYDYRHHVNDSQVRLSNWVRFTRVTAVHKEANLHKALSSDGAIEFVIVKSVKQGDFVNIFLDEVNDKDEQESAGPSVKNEAEIEAPLDLRKTSSSKNTLQTENDWRLDSSEIASRDSRYGLDPGTSRKRERPMLPCGVCGKTFDRPSLLKRHMRTHTGEKPHECDVCGKAFSTSSSLNTHRRIHSGERPHECPICLKRFTASSNLYYHRMTHVKDKPHKCVQCGKSFPTPGDLKSHTYVHSGSWPFRCPICSRGFSKQTNMRNHLFLHTGNKPHSCDRCGKRFALACNLRAHARTHEEQTNQSAFEQQATTNHIVPSPLAQAMLLAKGLMRINRNFPGIRDGELRVRDLKE